MQNEATARAHYEALSRKTGRRRGGGLRRLPEFMAVMAIAFVVLVVSAAACEGVGGVPATPKPKESGTTTQQCGKTVNCATGDETTTQTDTAIGGRGPGLNITRSYDAQASAVAQAEGEGIGRWGWGWTGPYEVSLLFGAENGQNTATVQQQNSRIATFYENNKGEYEQGGWIQARLVKEGSSYNYTLPDQSKLEFNSEGKLVKETERNGNATTLTYNGSKQLEKVTDATGRTLTFKYDGEGHVESIKDPMGHVVSYTYVVKGGLASVSIEGKVRWEFGYSATAPYLLSSMTDGRGHTITREYDSSHRVIKEVEAAHERKWSYGTNETTITEPNGSETVDTFNAAYEPTKVVEAKGTGSEKVTEYEYSGTTFALTKMIDPNKHATEYGYDSEDNRTSEKDPNGDEHKWTYDSKHNIKTETSPEGETATFNRNGNGEPEAIERPVGAETQKTEFKYDAYGDVTEIKDPLGNKTKYTYDAHGDKETETDAEGNERKWKYNTDSQETEETTPRGYATKIERNEYGLPTKITDPLGHSTEYKYDANQNVESETDGNKHTTKYEYNTENLPIKVTKPNGDTTETGYDTEGKKTSHTDGNSHTWEYKRNQLEQVTEEKNPLGKTWKKTYENAGNLQTLEDPEKHTTEYTYDATNRLTKIKYSTSHPSEVTYKYNKDSKVTEMKDETGATENTYDKLDRLTQYKNGAGKTVKYEYNLANLPAAITYPSGKSIAREYDKDNRLSKVTDWKGHATTFKYNADSRQTSTTFPAESENKDEYAYNEADQMTEIKMGIPGWSGNLKLTYERDADGQVTKDTGESGALGSATVESVLDENNRIIEFDKHAYTYDKANNPTEIEGEGPYTYNTADQLKESPTAKYKYNEDGDRTKLEPKSGEPATTYGYDQAGHLTSSERAKGTYQTEANESIAYDADGQEQDLTFNGTKYKLVWDTAEPLPMILEGETGTGEEEGSLIYGPEGLPFEEIFGLNSVYMHHDQQGSIRAFTYWEEGSLVAWRNYGPFGNTTEANGDEMYFTYDGQFTDNELGLVALGARKYDPNTAQFMSIDPALGLTGEPYSYTADNPENLADPSGLCDEPTAVKLPTVAITAPGGPVAQLPTVSITASGPAAPDATYVAPTPPAPYPTIGPQPVGLVDGCLDSISEDGLVASIAKEDYGVSAVLKSCAVGAGTSAVTSISETAGKVITVIGWATSAASIAGRVAPVAPASTTAAEAAAAALF